MDKRNSRIGLVGSILLHSAIAGSVWAVMLNKSVQEPTVEQEVTSISMEMLAGIEQQAQVAVAPEEKEEKEEPTVKEEEPIQKEVAKEEPLKEPLAEEKVVERPKNKPKETPKQPPKEKPKKIEKPKAVKVEKPKALEKGNIAKEGIIAKAAPEIPQAAKAQSGISAGNNNGKGTSTAATGGSASEISAYKAILQRALQRRANNAYPAREKMMRKTGTVTLSFSVLPSGQVSNVQVINSSGNSNLDAAAIKAAQGTKTEPPPVGFPTNVTVPVRFAIE